MHSTTIRQLLTTSFSRDALRTLCTDLGIDPERFGAKTSINLAQALLTFCERHNRTADLEAALYGHRLPAAWDMPPTTLFAERIAQVLHAAPLAYRRAVQRMVVEYQTTFVGRDAELTALDTWLAAGSHPSLLLLGPTGSGKTALLVQWVAHLQAQDAWAVIFVPISIRYQIAHPQAGLHALADSLAAAHGVSPYATRANLTPNQLRPLIADWLRQPLPDGRSLLIVLDGIDEAQDGWVDADLFPADRHAQVRVVVAARQDVHHTHTSWCEHLGWQPAHIAALVLNALSAAAVSDIQDQTGQSLVYPDSTTDVRVAITRIGAGNPLVVGLLTQAVQDTTLTPDVLASMESGLESVVHTWCDALRRQGRFTPAVVTLLSLCAVALGPLTSADVQALAPQAFPHNLDLQEAADTIAPFVSGDGSATNGFVFTHARLRELFAEQLFDADERRALQERFITYGLAWYDHCISVLKNTEPAAAMEVLPPLPAYLSQFWIAHLAAAGRWDVIWRVLVGWVRRAGGFQQAWLEARFICDGTYAGYLADLDRLWRYAEQRNNHTIVLRCALIAATIRSFNTNLAASLVEGLTTIGTYFGRWSSITVLDAVAQIPEQKQRAEALTTLLDAQLDLPWTWALEVVAAFDSDYLRATLLKQIVAQVAPALLTRAVTIARTIHEDRWQVMALCAIIPCLPQTEQSRVLVEARMLAQSMRDHLNRATALGQLAPLLPPDEQSGVLAEALAAVQLLETDHWRAQALEHLAPRLTTSLMSEALGMACTLQDAYQRARALAALIPHLAPNEQAEAVSVACAAIEVIAIPYQRASTLKRLTPYLSPSLLREAGSIIPSIRVREELILMEPEALMQALVASRQIQDGKSRAEALGQLVLHLPPDAQPKTFDAALGAYESILSLEDMLPHLPLALIPKALATTVALRHDSMQAGVLRKLIPNLPPALLDEALVVARAMSDASRRAKTLSTIAPHLPPAAQRAVWVEALTATCTLRDGYWRTEALEQLEPHLSARVLAEALPVARALPAGYPRASMLGVVAAHIPPPDQAAVLEEAIAATHALSSPREQAEILGYLAPYLSPAHVAEALAITSTLSPDHERTELLKRLIPHLPSSLFPEVIATARAMNNSYQRDDVFEQLATSAPPAEQPPLLITLLGIVCASGDTDLRTKLLKQLETHLSSGIVSDVAAIARALKPTYQRVALLTWLLLHTPPAAQEDRATEAFATISAIDDEYQRFRALHNLIPHLPATFLDEALTLARTLKDYWFRSVLGSLLSRLPAARQTEVLEDIRAIPEVSHRAATLLHCLKSLPPIDQPGVLLEVLAAVRTLSTDEERSPLLSSINGHLSHVKQPEVLAEVLAIVRDLRDDYERALMLKTVAAHMPLAEQPGVWIEALNACRGIRTMPQRILLLEWIAPKLPSTEQAQLLPEERRALHTAKMRRDQWITLAELDLPLSSSLPSSLAAACAHRQDYRRKGVLVPLAEELAAQQRSGTPTLAYWHLTLRLLAIRGRAALLADLRDLTPWLVALTDTKTRTATAQAIVDVAWIWP